ncbi:hypothetical protein GQ593_10720 [Gilliamella sp. Pas-s25]|nr:hypothetical protein [Gilliamella sp. Pas-s25]MWP62814.1 hypothetical protein [Gilliamella sp. Pas-s25]
MAKSFQHRIKVFAQLKGSLVLGIMPTALNIEKRIINGNYAIPPYFPYCAYAISSVLDEYGLQELYWLPGSLKEAVKEIEDKKGQTNENN